MGESAIPSIKMNEMNSGESCALEGFSDDLDSSYRERLMEFGFHPGETVTCMKAPGFGAPKLFRVSNTIYSLDAHIADKVFVDRKGGSSK